MNKWQETVKRVSKQHPGKSLTYILPIAKVEYRKMGHGSTKSAKKGRKGRRTMKGGSSCASSSDSVQGGAVVDNVDGGGVAAFDGNWSGEDSLITGGSKRRGRGSKRRGRGSKRRGRGSKRRGSKRRGSKRRGSKRR